MWGQIHGKTLYLSLNFYEPKTCIKIKSVKKRKTEEKHDNKLEICKRIQANQVMYQQYLLQLCTIEKDCSLITLESFF